LVKDRWYRTWERDLAGLGRLTGPTQDGDMTATTGLSYGTATNQFIHAGNGIDYAYREIGTGTIPLALLQQSAATATATPTR